jgi:nitroimidazol reductase NimA-like FMN-containing flavoprotein (pyridoxamine 5'-phosphate oxidase superfamily)
MVTIDAASERVRVRRGAQRARYDSQVVHSILDAGLVAHVGVTTADGPIVLPMAYGHDGERLYLHGAVGNALLGQGDGAEVCATVTSVDALVIARSPFHDSMNYRSVVVRGRAERLDEPTAKVAALRLVADHVVANWATGRGPTDEELRRTLVLALPLTEASAKVRTGGPGDEPSDLVGPHWGGTVSLVTTFGQPEPAEDLAVGIEPPTAIAALAGRRR